MAKKIKEPKITIPQDEKALAREQFVQLQHHAGWARIVKFLDEKIVFYRRQLEEKKINSLDELERIRDKIKLCTQIRNTPEILIAFIDLAEANQVETDPFYTSEDIIKH